MLSSSLLCLFKKNCNLFFHFNDPSLIYTQSDSPSYFHSLSTTHRPFIFWTHPSFHINQPPVDSLLTPWTHPSFLLSFWRSILVFQRTNYFMRTLYLSSKVKETSLSYLKLWRLENGVITVSITLAKHKKPSPLIYGDGFTLIIKVSIVTHLSTSTYVNLKIKLVLNSKIKLTLLQIQYIRFCYQY